jgi:Lar family restriction alleviation protein
MKRQGEIMSDKPTQLPKPCPFCGCENEEQLIKKDWGDATWCVVCDACETYGPSAPTEDDAVSLWNKAARLERESND